MARVRMQMVEKSMVNATGIVSVTYVTPFTREGDRASVYRRLPDTIEVELVPTRLEALTHLFEGSPRYTPEQQAARVLDALGLDDGPVRP